MYWVTQKVHLASLVTSYGKAQTNFLANPIHTLIKKTLHYQTLLTILQQHKVITNLQSVKITVSAKFSEMRYACVRLGE